MVSGPREAVIASDIRAAKTLPSAHYYDPGIFAQVRERVFARSWQWVMDTGGLKTPGTVLPFRLLPGLLDEPMVAVRDTHDALRPPDRALWHLGQAFVRVGLSDRFARGRFGADAGAVGLVAAR